MTSHDVDEAEKELATTNWLNFSDKDVTPDASRGRKRFTLGQLNKKQLFSGNQLHNLV